VLNFTGNDGAGGTLTATLTSDCGNLTLTAPVYAGPPVGPVFEQLDPSDICYSKTGYFRIVNYSPALAYTVRATGASAFNDGGGTFRIKGGGNSQQATFSVTAANGCGTSTNSGGYVSFACPQAYLVYPNPAADELTVEPTGGPEANANTPAARKPEAAAMAESTGISAVRIYDNYGQLRLEQAGNEAKTVRLRVNSLPAGFYVVHILRGGQVMSRQQLKIER